MNSGGISFANAISPVQEIVSYEALWTKYSTFKQLADAFKLYDMNDFFPDCLESYKLEKKKPKQ
ncbi:MAG: hypothetical protein WA865_04075 [Spirulinaceae cyanobacterium]